MGGCTKLTTRKHPGLAQGHPQVQGCHDGSEPQLQHSRQLSVPLLARSNTSLTQVRNDSTLHKNSPADENMGQFVVGNKAWGCDSSGTSASSSAGKVEALVVVWATAPVRIGHDRCARCIVAGHRLGKGWNQGERAEREERSPASAGQHVVFNKLSTKL